jgi:hypothetical protein
MEIKATRTLVKSAPELWELADDPARMEAWAKSLVETQTPLEIVVTERKLGQRLTWRACTSGGSAEIAVALAEKGFGTAVEITARRPSAGPTASDALERVLDELGSPDRRAFFAD